MSLSAMENSAEGKKRNPSACRKKLQISKLFSNVLNDVHKSNSKRDLCQSLRVTIFNREIESQTSDSTERPLKDQTTFNSKTCIPDETKPWNKKITVHSKELAPSEIDNEKSQKSFDWQTSNSKPHYTANQQSYPSGNANRRNKPSSSNTHKYAEKYDSRSAHYQNGSSLKSHDNNNSNFVYSKSSSISGVHHDKPSSNSSHCFGYNTNMYAHKYSSNSNQSSFNRHKNDSRHSNFHKANLQGENKTGNTIQSSEKQNFVGSKNLPHCIMKMKKNILEEKLENNFELSNERIKHQYPFFEIKEEHIKMDQKNESVPAIISNDCSLSSCISSNLSDNSIYCDSMPILLSSEDYIPGPVLVHSTNTLDAPCTDLKEKESYSLQNQSLDVHETFVDGDLAPLPDSKHLEAISDFILSNVKERSVALSSYSVIYDLNVLFKQYFEGNTIELYGSYSYDLAITTSDINLVILADVSIRKSFMFEVYKLLTSEFKKYNVLPFDEGSTAHKSKINFLHPDSGVSCQLAYLGKYKDGVFKMGKFLKRMCGKDDRVKPLIIYTKVWAEYFNINEVDDGKLHSVGFALLVIHFLQHCENQILPVYSSNDEIQESLSPNTSSIGELWLEFLRYYCETFNWKQDVVTVTSMQNVSKKSKQWETYWMAIEDPFSHKNIAESVTNSDVANYIVSIFKASYDYFCTPPEISCSYNNNQDGNTEPDSCKLEFSLANCDVGEFGTSCDMCFEIDDVCDECKSKLYVQPMDSVPKMTDSFLSIIKKALLYVYDKYMLSDEEVKRRKQFVKELENEVCKIYPDAHLCLFGSSTNGFGFKNSDLDICMTFKLGKEIKVAQVFVTLRRLLRENKNFDTVIAIFNANIPIIKFRYKPEGWRGDISLVNTLGVHNSELLYTYSLIDERCKILGCALKLLAKKALISEVTDKALSSYSYLIMVIHFLQQTNPPVLPILQDNEFREGNFELGDIVENCNVWFCRDVNYVKTKFKAENNTPVEQLFLNLLDYYCSFDYKHVITIRQKEMNSVSKKMPPARLFNIQDPFIETKNLGCVVSATKAQETTNIFKRARRLFRTPVKEIPSIVKDIEDYFFSTMSLTGRIHKEAVCDLCGKFGHEQKECKHEILNIQRKKCFTFSHHRRNVYANHVPFKRSMKQPCRQRI